MTEFEFDVADRKGCTFNMKLREQLEVMKKLLPEEYKQCWMLWGKVYKEYERLNYHLTY